MAKPKRSITRDSVFRTTGKTPPPKQGISKPEAKTYQTAVWLTDEETDWIDTRLEIKKSWLAGSYPFSFYSSTYKSKYATQYRY